MAATATASLHLFLILSLFACSCSVKSTVFPLTRREILNSFRYKVVRHDSTPSAPAAIVTVPATNPIGVTPNAPVTPVTTPASPAGAQPVTNPVTTPASPGAQPVTNPNPTPTPTPPTSTTNPPVGGGQSWCVAKSGLSETTLQTALNYACGVGGADCSAIQQGGSCYNPISLQNHASFAFNSYYQKNPAPTSCDFGGSATITNQNPSSGSCVYPASSSSSSASGTPSIVPTARPGAPSNALNSSTNYPPSGGTSTGGGTMGASPPTDGSYASLSNHLQAAVGSIALVTFITTTVLISPLRQDHGWKSLH